MPLTALTTFIGSVVMISSWLFIRHRIAHSVADVPPQVRLLNGFFMHTGIFFLFMFAPNLLLAEYPQHFPVVMAWGYTIGHIFLYLGILKIIRLMFSLSPRIAPKVNVGLAVGIIATILLTVLNVVTMVYGLHPVFDANNHVTLFNAHPALGLGIALFSAITVLPTAILMIINGVRNPSARLRSFLLGTGLFVLMTGGPLHDNAKTWQVYALADIVSMFALLVLAAGVTYRLEERIAPESRSINVNTLNTSRVN